MLWIIDTSREVFTCTVGLGSLKSSRHGRGMSDSAFADFAALLFGELCAFKMSLSFEELAVAWARLNTENAASFFRRQFG